MARLDLSVMYSLMRVPSRMIKMISRAVMASAMNMATIAVNPMNWCRVNLFFSTISFTAFFSMG